MTVPQTKKINRIPLKCVAFLLTMSLPLFGQYYEDVVCFTIPLNEDPSSLFFSAKGEDVRKTLAGPVLMDAQTLLFYSCNGYALYRPSGELIDSYCIIKENKKLAFEDPRRLKCAYPLDLKTMLFCKRGSDQKDSLEVYQKTIFKKGISRLEQKGVTDFRDMEHSQLFNLANNGIIDEMAPKTFLMPNLVGYSSLSSGKKWWSLDRFYSFLSPVIEMQDAFFQSFFAGIRTDQKTDVEKQLVSPLGTYAWDGLQYYFGVHSVLGTSSIESKQTLYLCDQSGNVLFNNQLMKQVLIDDVLEHDKKSNTDYTVKRFWQFVTLPAITENGDLYYGICDYRTRTIEVHKRMFLRYMPTITDPGFEDLIDVQKRFFLKPSAGESQPERKNRSGEAAGLAVRDDRGKRRPALISDCTCKGYYAVFTHEPDPELKKRLSFSVNGVPPDVKHARDSLSHLTTASRPYAFSVFGQDGSEVRTMHYGPGDEIIAVRVIHVDSADNIFIRVDLKNWAETIVCSRDGSHISRFTFNRDECQKRKDIVAVTNSGAVIEEDYEHIKEDYTYFKWELTALKQK
jgi:hypothetical protein